MGKARRSSVLHRASPRASVSSVRGTNPRGSALRMHPWKEEEDLGREAGMTTSQ